MANMRLRYLLDPGFFIIDVSEQLLKIIGFLKSATSLTCHVRDPATKIIKDYKMF